MATMLLSACGGGGGGGGSAIPTSTAPSPAEGIWNGTTNTNRTASGVVLDDGTFYVFYTRAFSSSVAGVLQGATSASNGTFTSANAKDFNFGDGIGVVNVNLSGSYSPKTTLTGSAVYGGTLGTSVFSTTYSSTYDQTPSLTALAGIFVGQVVTSAGVENANLTVGINGVISGTGASGCQVSGTAAPRSRGNVYNFTISFGAFPCLFANQTFTGAGILNSTGRTLYAAAPNAARTDGIMFIGTK